MQETLASTLQLDVDQLKKGKAVLRAINHSLRQQLLRLVHQKGKVKVTELYKTLKIEQSVASQHLAFLRSAKLVRTERVGKCIYYSINYNKLTEISELSAELAATK